MNAITDIRCVLTQKAIDALCDKFHISGEVHPVLPNQNDTMHERPSGKIGLYTRFFDYANFRLPLSTFLVNVQAFLYQYISTLCDWGGQEAFMCLVGLSRHYTLDEETYLWFLHKNEEGVPYVICVVRALRLVVLFLTVRLFCTKMDIFAFIHTPDPTKSPLIVLKASWKIVLRDCLMRVDAAPVQARRRGKRKFVVMDAGGVSHPPKKLRGDHGTSSRACIGAYVSTTSERKDGDHTDSMVKPNLCTIGAPQRFVISSDSSHHSVTKVAEAEVDSLIRSFVPIMTTVTTTTSTVDPTLATKRKFVGPSPFATGSSSAGETDPITGVFSDQTSSDFLVGAIRTVINPDTDLQNFTSLNGLFTEFNVGAARQMCLSVEVRMRAEYNVKEKRRLKSVVENQGELLKAREEETESLKARLLLKEAKAAEAIHLCAEASNFETMEKSLRDETNALRECNVILEKERNALDVKMTKLETSVVNKERELTNLNALVYELEISSCGLQEKVTVYENCMEQLEKFLDDRTKVVNDKFDKLYTNFVEMTLHLEEKFYPHLLTTISGRRWLLTQGMELAIIKCLNLPEYLSTLGAAIDKAIEKGMQDGLSAGITHGKEGRVLTDVAAYNPSAEADYISALQQF
nr:transposase (putative), gypsy type [Tanacetum cinerariifolium]